MGKKSSEKKKRRIPEHKHPEHKHDKKKLLSITKTEKDIKIPNFKIAKNTEETSQTTHKEPRKRIPPHKIFGTLLSFIMLTILIVVGSMLYETAFKPTSIAKYLPYDRTAAFIEVNTNIDHVQVQKAEKLLAKTEYSFDKLAGQLKTNLNIDVKKDSLEWLGRELGIAELLTGDQKKTLETVYFVETLSQGLTETFLKQLAEKNSSTLQKVDSKGYELYSFNKQAKKFYTSFLDNYLVVSTSKESINILMNGKSENSDKVYKSDDYENILGNMPLNKVGFVYINFKNSKDLLLGKYGLTPNSPFITYAIHPFSEFFKSEGAALIASDNSFEVQSFLNLNSDYVQGSGDIMYKEQYDANLTKYIPDTVQIFFGGKNLEKQIKRVVNILSEGQGSDTSIFDNVTKTYVQKYFGSGVSFQEDVSSILKGEFAVAVASKDNKNIYDIILDITDTNDGELKFQKLANNFISYGTVFDPQIEEHELPDGTKSREIVAKQQTLVRSDSKYGSYTIHELKTENGDWGMFYSISDNLAFISTDKNVLIGNLALLSNEKKNSVKNSSIFNIHIKGLLPNSDEVSYFDISKFWPNLKFIKSLSTGRQYSANGVMAYYYIYVE